MSLVVMLFVSMLMLSGLSGCSKGSSTTIPPTVTTNTNTGPSFLTQLKPTLTALDRAGVAELGNLGFQNLAKKSPDTVTASVTALKASLEGDIIPWLQNQGPLSTGNSTAQLVDQKLLAALPADVKLAIKGTLDTAVAALNVPAASTVISADDLAYILAAVQGLDDACGAFLATPLPAPATPKAVKTVK